MKTLEHSEKDFKISIFKDIKEWLNYKQKQEIKQKQVDLNNLLETLKIQDFPGGSVVKNPPANAGDTGSSPGPGTSHMLQSN